eukprot:TRINITY_DN16631_c0_g1_i3.p1 TRINITY_DN16631_c0_g1~~TRINITY_DN16631_c0_g1_i3.p1  ORF type:complete len:177 (+),score=26.93 TRINITY_DN16631_c0_g1_i3:439-969(+)
MKKLELARHNARIYGVEDKIEYICGDYTKLLHTLEADIVFLSPPWGGPLYNTSAYFDLADIQLSDTAYDGKKLFNDTKRFVSKNIIYFLPKNTLSDQIVRLAPPNEKVEVEHNSINMKVKSICAYFGDLAGSGNFMRHLKKLLTTIPPELVVKRERQDQKKKRSNQFIPMNKKKKK